MITVQDILNLQVLKKTILVAGQDGLNRIIRHATVMEVPDIYQWLKGNEFIITSFFAIKDNIEEQCNLINNLANVNSAAIAIKVNRFIDTIPAEVIELGNKLSFPIIEIPKDINYIDILDPIFQMIIENNNKQKKDREFIEEIIFGTFNNDNSILEYGKSLGYNIEDSFYYPISVEVKEVDGSTGSRRCFDVFYQSLIHLIEESDTPYLLLTTGKFITFFLEYSSSENASKKGDSMSKYLFSKLRQHNIIFGIGEVGNGIDAIQKGYFQSRNAIKLSKTLFGAVGIYKYNSFGFYNFFNDKHKDELNEMVDKIIGPLKKDNPVFLDSLIYFFESNEDIESASKKMFVHQNTLKYRLNRIKEITNFDVRITSEKIQLYLAVLIYKLYRTELTKKI